MATTSGFARDLMLTSQQIFAGASPDAKITTPGFLRLCIDAARPQIVSAAKNEGTGHVKDIKLKYRQRSVSGNTSSSLTCDADQMRLFNEATISQSLFRQVAINFDFETIAKFEADASVVRKSLNRPGGSPAFESGMNIVWDAIAAEMNGLLADIDTDLLAKMALNFGYNYTTGLNTAKTVNFPQATTTNVLASGMTSLLSDILANEMDMNNAAIVGNGLIISYWLQNVAKAASGAAQNGINQAALGMPAFYADYYSATSWGSNKFAIVDKRALQFLDLNTYQGFRATELGTSTFFKMPMLLTDSMGNSFSMDFDVQIKTRDCAETIHDRYGQNITVAPGITVYIRKPFDIYVQPGNAYGATDRLAGNNGTLLYTATNS